MGGPAALFGGRSDPSDARGTCNSEGLCVSQELT